MSNDPKTDMLSRIRSSLGQVTRERPSPVPVNDALVRTAGGGDVSTAFRAAAELVGAHVHPCSRDDFATSVSSLLMGLGIQSVTCSIGDPLLEAEMLRAISIAGVRRVDPESQAGMRAHFLVGAGITDVAAAIAESGTLVLHTGPGRNRGSFIAPPVHIAIVRARQIIPDLVDLWPSGGVPGPLPATSVLVTGPSKTADIEGILITGVHGPGQLHIFLMQE